MYLLSVCFSNLLLPKNSLCTHCDFQFNVFMGSLVCLWVYPQLCMCLQPYLGPFPLHYYFVLFIYIISIWFDFSHPLEACFLMGDRKWDGSGWKGKWYKLIVLVEGEEIIIKEQYVIKIIFSIKGNNVSQYYIL